MTISNLSDVFDLILGGPIGEAVDEAVEHLTGKDGSWHISPGADHTWLAERHFTERRGMQYSPRVWAFLVDESGAIHPANDPAKALIDALNDAPLDSE